MNFRTAIITSALLLGGIGMSTIAPAFAQGGATPVSTDDAIASVDTCPDELFGPDSEPWIRSDLNPALAVTSPRDNGTMVFVVNLVSRWNAGRQAEQ